MLNRRVFGTDPDIGCNEIPRRAGVLRQVRPASVPLLPRPRPRTSVLRLGDSSSALWATRKFGANCRPEFAGGVSIFDPAKLARYPKDRKFEIVFPMLL